MLESWVSSLQRGIAGQNVRWVRKAWNLSPGAWISAAVVLAIGMRLLWVHQSHNGHRQQIAAAFGAVNTFYGPAQLSHNGTKLLYVGNTQTRSCALYLYELNSKQTREVFVEHNGLGSSGDDFELRSWGWSPDDAAFIYTIRDKLVVCPVDAVTNAEELVVGLKTVSQVAWLAPNRFAFINQDNSLCFARKLDGKWQQSWIWFPDNLTNLVAVSSNTVAWLQKGLICRLNVDECQAAQPRPTPATNNRMTPNSTISWAYDGYGFDQAQPCVNSGLPVSNTWAGIVLASNWNDSWMENSSAAQVEGVTVSGLYDNTGCQTSVEITYAAYNGGGIVERHKGIDADGSYNREMLNGILRAGPAGWGSPITNTFVAFNNVPYAAYDAIVYFGSEVGGRHGRISDGATSYYFSTLGPAAVNGANGVFLPASQAKEPIFPEADYAFFTGLTNSSCVFTSYPLSNDQWLGISAVQLIQSSNVFLVGEMAPTTQTVANGKPAHFSVMAGGQTPCFQWRHAGTNLTDATNALYSIKTVVAGDSGDYYVVVFNDFNSITSSVATLFCVSTKTNSGASSRIKTNQAQNPVIASRSEADVSTNGLALWLDASILQQADQTPVAGLNDLSDSHNDAVEDGHVPLFNSPDGAGGLNSRGTVHFSSSGSLSSATGLKTIRSLGISGRAPRTVIAVMRRDPGRSMFVSLGNCSVKGEYCGICDQENAVYLPAGMVTDNAFPALPPKWNILSVVYDGSEQKGFVDEVFLGASSFPMNTPDARVELGVRRDGEDQAPSAASDGDFAELLVYDRALDADERLQVENYLSQKWFGGNILKTLNPFLWINPPVSRITGFSYSQARHEWLISSLRGPTTVLWRYDTNGVLTELTKGNTVQDARWISSDDFGYLNNQPDYRRIIISPLAGAKPEALFKQGNVDWYAPDDTSGRMLFFGIVSNEPASGVWLYDQASRQLKSLVAYSDYPCNEAKKITPFSGVFSFNWPGINFLIFPPAKVDRHKKYPLIITDTVPDNVEHGPMFNSALAGCDAYVAIVERKGWFWGIEDWETNVLNLYQKIKQDPAVDTGRIYLYATSAETKYMSDLVEKTPGLWRGLILLNPGQLPGFSRSPRFQARPKILLSVGGEEHEEDRLKQYQANALTWGVMVEYIIAPGEPHRMMGKKAKLERAKAVEHFIFEE